MIDGYEVDTIEIEGVDYILTIEHYSDGMYMGWIAYGEKDGIDNCQISVGTHEKERITELLAGTISKLK